MKVLNIIFILILSSFIVTAAQQTIISSSNDFRFDLFRSLFPPENPKIKCRVYLNCYKGRTGWKGWKHDKQILINISHRDEYTKAELERARKQVLTKIYEYLRL